jgi:hypothetical protein
MATSRYDTSRPPSDEMLSFLENYRDGIYTLWEVHEGP